MASEQEHLRKMETESIKKVHNARIKTEDKYRVYSVVDFYETIFIKRVTSRLS